jgi:SAM-dependent methyltransferase
MTQPLNPWLATRSRDGDAYDEPYERRAAAGEDVHGEANFVSSYDVRSVLDAGCGTGRVTRELARRGLSVVGVDLDPAMLGTGQRKAPELEWHVADLETIDLGRTFDAVIMTGNVMIFLTPGTEGRVLSNLARHVKPSGLLIAGFQLSGGRLSIGRYDDLAAQAGFELAERFSTWDKDPWVAGGGYGVSVHRLV